MLLSASASVAAPEGVVIGNTADAVYAFGSVAGLSVRSNEVQVTTTVVRTPAALELLLFAPVHPDARQLTVNETEFSTSGQSLGPFDLLPPPSPSAPTTPSSSDSPFRSWRAACCTGVNPSSSP